MGRFNKGEVSTAIRTLRRNKGRSMFTMLGIVIAVASVVIVVGVGEGVTRQIAMQTDQLAKDVITIRPGQIDTTAGLSSLTSLGSTSVNGVLSNQDISVVAQTPGIKSVVPVGVISGGIVVGQKNRHYDVSVIATTSAFPALFNQSVAYGTFFDESDSPIDKVILGAHVAGDEFDQNVPLGQTLSILGRDFIVSGILRESPDTSLFGDIDFNNSVFINYDEAQQLTSNNTRLYELVARLTRSDQADAVATSITKNVLTAHGGQQDFTVLKQGQSVAVTNNILRLLTAVMAVVAAISLLVGGVGIMNVMLVSVTERMHEVGIRKALGATNRQVLRQFVIEAAVLSIAGATIGVLVAFMFELGLLVFTNLTPIFSWQAALVACGVAVVVGVLFGSIPAFKAARKDPISALRNM